MVNKMCVHSKSMSRIFKTTHSQGEKPPIKPIDGLRDADSSEEQKAGRSMIRRKSYLPADFDTAMALQQYHTVDSVLPSSQET